MCEVLVRLRTEQHGRAERLDRRVGTAQYTGCVLLANPEREWPQPTETVDRADVERRIGPTNLPLEVLSGGLRNLNVRVGRDRVLRIQRRIDRAPEAALLAQPWRAFRSPALLASGADWLLVEHVAHGPLPATADAGAAAGRALAEIHARSYPHIGFLGADLTLAQPMADDDFTPRGYGHLQLQDAGAFLGAERSARIAVRGRVRRRLRQWWGRAR